jgi:hypothetical protein
LVSSFSAIFLDDSAGDPVKARLSESFINQGSNIRGGNEYLSLSGLQKTEKKSLALPVQFAGHVVKEQYGRLPRYVLHNHDLGRFECQDERTLLPLRTVQSQEPPIDHKEGVVSMGSSQSLSHFSFSVFRPFHFPPQRLFLFLNRRGAGGILNIRFLPASGYIPVGLPQKRQQPVQIKDTILPYPGSGFYQPLGPGLDLPPSPVFPEQAIALSEKATIFLGSPKKGRIGLEYGAVE